MAFAIFMLVAWLLPIFRIYLVYVKSMLLHVRNKKLIVYDTDIKRKAIHLALWCCILVTKLVAQDSVSKKASLKSWVFLDTYYSYDFTKPATHEKAPFLYNHNRHNEVNVNLALVSLTYKNEKTRGAVGLMTGTYAQYNLAAEPLVLQHIFEANAGLKLSEKTDLWVDAGVLPSHIGFESAVSKDCWTLTRSILAENSPYYETGARLSYTTNSKKWYVAGLLLNGWQRISRLPGNNTPAFGTQVTYSPSERFMFNWSTFIGNEKPDSNKQRRYFNNLFAIWNLSAYWALTVGFDYGLEQGQPGLLAFNQWYTPIAILRYENKKWAVAARVEYYNDKAGVIVPLVNAHPFQMQGYSINADRKIDASARWRVEWRLLSNRYPYFKQGNVFVSSNQFLTTSIVIDFTR